MQHTFIPDTGDTMAQALHTPQALGRWPIIGAGLRSADRRLVLLLGDVLALLCAGVGALAAWSAVTADVAFGREALGQYSPWFLVLGAVWLALWAVNGGYDLRLAAQVRQSHRRLLATAAVLGLIYLLAFFLLSIPSYAIRLRGVQTNELRLLRLLPTLFVLFTLLGEVLWRSAYARTLTGGRFRRRTLVIGAGQSGRAIVQALRQYGDGTYEVLGFVDDAPEKKQRTIVAGAPSGLRSAAEAANARPMRVLGDRYALKDLIAGHGVSTLVLAITHEANGELLPVLLDCLELGVEIVPMAVLYEQLTGRVPVEHVGDSWYVAMPIQPPSTGGLFPLLRRAMDIALAGLGLVFLAIAFPFIALAIYLDSPGPIFYSQERVGKGGRLFRVFKFRTMVPDAENGQAVWAQEDDPRVTRVGRLLRKTHIDEFPQFINILRGEMSPVGPRPERPEFVEELAREMPFYRIRHAVRPGMAGWALIRQGYAASKEDALIRLQYDLYYIKHQSIWLDLVILGKTVVDMLTLGGR